MLISRKVFDPIPTITEGQILSVQGDKYFVMQGDTVISEGRAINVETSSVDDGWLFESPSKTTGYTLWFMDHTVSISFQKTNWPKGNYYFQSNRGREPNEVLDINLAIWKFAFSFTIWNMSKAASRIAKAFLPEKF